MIWPMSIIKRILRPWRRWLQGIAAIVLTVGAVYLLERFLVGTSNPDEWTSAIQAVTSVVLVGVTWRYIVLTTELVRTQDPQVRIQLEAEDRALDELMRVLADYKQRLTSAKAALSVHTEHASEEWGVRPVAATNGLDELFSGLLAKLADIQGLRWDIEFRVMKVQFGWDSEQVRIVRQIQSIGRDYLLQEGVDALGVTVEMIRERWRDDIYGHLSSDEIDTLPGLHDLFKDVAGLGTYARSVRKGRVRVSVHER